MARGDQLARQWRIIQTLVSSKHGKTVAELGREENCTLRTIYRDLERMDLDAGLPIWNDKGRYGLDDDAFLPPLALTLHEAMAFFLAARLLTKATDELDTEIIGVFVKLARLSA